jgi:uncharacterized membrane protein
MEHVSAALVTVLAVGTGVVVIVVAIAVVLVVLMVTMSLRDRRKRAAEARHDLDRAHERAGRTEREENAAQEQAEPRTEPDK